MSLPLFVIETLKFTIVPWRITVYVNCTGGYKLFYAPQGLFKLNPIIINCPRRSVLAENQILFIKLLID